MCISRTAGAGGEEIGRLVSQRLGFRYVDEDVVMHAAAQAGIDPEIVADEERRKPLFLGLLDYLGDGADLAVFASDGTKIPSPVVRNFIREAIRAIASQGNAVIVAHAASYALAGSEEEGRPLRVLVTAPPEIRAGRIATDEQVSERDAAKVVGRSDSDRADYLKRFYGVAQELPFHYDLVLNTERISADEAVDLIERAVGERTILSDGTV